ncbi:T9SS type A sorting domain-containing protein, partial [Dolichospermum sp. ST_sed4]|nr:T9SS type A sorting domain-containing protein [Dolichospermum sp. ST_sed4]
VTIGSVKGQGTTTTPNNYTFIDKLSDAGKYFYRLKQMDYGGKYEYSQTVEVNWSPFTSYKLEQNYPNPFNPTTTIGFGIMEKGNVRLSILNILGEEIKVLLNEEKEAGYHSIDFNASDLPSSVYFYRIQAVPSSSSGQVFIETKKMVLLK